MDLILALWVTNPNPLGGGGENTNSQGFGVPLKIKISSKYVIDNSGKIRKHQILESRLDGILTHGNAYLRWIRGLVGEEDDGRRVAPLVMESLVDAITWVRSMQDCK